MCSRNRAAAIGVLLALIVAPTAAYARDGRVAGRVTSISGEGLAGAIITLFKQDKNGGTISFTRADKTGAYILASLAPGSYYLQVSREGYQPLTQSEVKIDPGRTTQVNIVLQQFLDLISAEPDPRNWELKTVLRSTYDRRMIFRSLQPDAPGPAETENAFHRAGAVTVTSATGLGGDSYSIFPSSGESGITSNFAFVEPVSDKGRLIFAGQLNTGYDPSWRVRNTYHLRPSAGSDFKLSLGYQQLTLNGPRTQVLGRPSKLVTQDPAATERGVRTLDLGFEAKNNLFDLMEVEYGFDVTRVHYAGARTFFSPFLQVVLTPIPGWAFRTSVAARRASDNSTLALPGGDEVNLASTAYIARIGGDVLLSRYHHAEIGVGRTLQNDTSFEVALYQDRMRGPGFPFMVAEAGRNIRPLMLVQPAPAQTRHKGMRFSMNRRIIDAIHGSIAYVYGSGSSLEGASEKMPRELLARNLLSYMTRSYYHALAGQIEAVVPYSRTRVMSVVRWYPGYSLTPIDLFADRTDMLGKGVNFQLRQPLPIPEFMGTPGRWEALVDLRNVFESGAARLSASDGQLILYRVPRTLRFGINLNLY